MAAGIFPTAEALFCAEPCGHRDCETGRLVWALRECGQCGQLVMPGERYYGWPIYSTVRAGDLVHALCVELSASVY